jgi:hypothetical protein
MSSTITPRSGASASSARCGGAACGLENPLGLNRDERVQRLTSLALRQQRRRVLFGRHVPPLDRGDRIALSRAGKGDREAAFDPGDGTGQHDRDRIVCGNAGVGKVSG